MLIQYDAADIYLGWCVFRFQKCSAKKRNLQECEEWGERITNEERKKMHEINERISTNETLIMINNRPINEYLNFTNTMSFRTCNQFSFWCAGKHRSDFILIFFFLHILFNVFFRYICSIGISLYSFFMPCVTCFISCRVHYTDFIFS